ncbi:MAG: anti-sigma factor [Candidatus Eisenbacteria bacterium]|nr:zf-HC2 domain-containing protein [Candidatus Eisenbacteria bacterium]
MQCDDAKSMLSLFADSNLEGEELQGAMFRHLQECSDCRGFFDSILRQRKAASVEREMLLREADELLPAAESLLARARSGRAERRSLSVWQRILAGGGMRMPVPVAISIAIVLLLAGIVLGTRIAGRPGQDGLRIDRLERASRSEVVVVCGLPEVQVVGSTPKR